MRSQNDVPDQRSLTPFDKLIGVFIMMTEWIFFISAPVIGMILVALALTLLALLGSIFIPPGSRSGDPSGLIVLLCTPPLGILLGFYMFKKVNQRMTRGRQQKNFALAIKSGAGIAGLVFITGLILTLRSNYEYLNSFIIVNVVSLIPSVFVGGFMYGYLNRLST